jgi:hypothetical protein
VSYSWAFGDGQTSPDSLPNHTYGSAGFYSVCLTITDANGCVSTYCDSLFYAYKTGGGPMRQLNALSRNSVGIKDVNTPVVSVYPNPANSEVNVSVAGKVDRISIYNAEGQKLKEVISPVVNKIAVNELASGIYFVEVQSKEITGRAKFTKVN